MTIVDLIADTRTALEMPEFEYPKIIAFPFPVMDSGFSDEQILEIIDRTVRDLTTK
jgi:hypothetical protein